MRLFVAATLVLVVTAPTASAQRPGSGPLLGRLEAIDARLVSAVASVRRGTLPRGFAATIRSIDGDVAELGHALPQLGAGPARASVVYYGLRDADTKLALARKHVRLREPGAAAAVRSAASAIRLVAREVSRQRLTVTAAFRSIARHAMAVARRTVVDDRDVRALMMRKDRLVKDLPAVAGVPFATFYDGSFLVHARLGHALRTTLHDEPDAVLNELLGARRATRSLEVSFRKA